MQRKNYILAYTLVSLGLICMLFFIGLKGWLGFFENSVQVSIFSLSSLFPTFSSSKNEIQQLKAENVRLASELSQKQVLENDNNAFRDQFDSQAFPPMSLIPARVVGQPSAIPNVAFPEELIIDKGKKTGVDRGMVVIFQNNGIGQITSVTDYFAKVMLVSNNKFALSGKDSTTGAVGVIRGLGNGEIIFDSVLLSDTLHVGDLVVSQGSQDMSGKGFAPNIVIGKITGVERSPSALFQSARVSPLLDFSKVSQLFVLTSL